MSEVDFNCDKYSLILCVLYVLSLLGVIGGIRLKNGQLSVARSSSHTPIDKV